MGCPSTVELTKNLSFSIATHDPDTGVLTDADALPTYRIYEEGSDTALLTGSFAKLDDANTTGKYRATVGITAANGFELDKGYTISISATVDSDTGGITYDFTVTDLTFIKDIEGGRWKIDTVLNQMIFYKSDNTTEVARFNLYDEDGNATYQNVFERTRV